MKDLFKVVFQKTDDQLKLVGASDSGACVCVCLITQESGSRVCYIANVGDTRAILSRNNQAIRLSFDHKATNEEEATRIRLEITTNSLKIMCVYRKAGGAVFKNRVLGTLAVTRTLGDLELKPAVTHKINLKNCYFLKGSQL